MPCTGILGLKASPANSVEELFRTQDDFWVLDKRENTYSQVGQEDHALKNRILELEFICSRNELHKIVYIVRVSNGSYEKIGQFPSIADLQKNNIKKYRKILGKEKSTEFSKAVGLSAHGVGIGSFVYLRRIFESLIEEAHQEAKVADDWAEEEFGKQRMDGKILFLKNHLPNFLVENRSIYSILSSGVHALSEQDCLKYFEPVKLAIEIILDEKIEKQEKQEKESITRKALSAIRSSLGS